VTTGTLDYDTVPSGEVYLIHNAGETLLRSGDVAVIPGLRQGWRTSDKGCTLSGPGPQLAQIHVRFRGQFSYVADELAHRRTRAAREARLLLYRRLPAGHMAVHPRPRLRCQGHPGLGPRKMRVNHEYERGGTLDYLAAYDVHRVHVIGLCYDTTPIRVFGGRVATVTAVHIGPALRCPHTERQRCQSGGRGFDSAGGPGDSPLIPNGSGHHD
jgi:hypothetical protein